MSDQQRILLIEDEPHLAQGIQFNLEMEGYHVTHADTGELGLAELKKQPFDILVLDLMLPGIDGLEVCRRTRAILPQLPILMLTARAEDKDRVAGLETGADDYLTKPFNLAEFLLRVKGLLKRSKWYRSTPAQTLYKFGGNVVDLHEQTATTATGDLQLTGQEIKLLKLFFDHEGQILSRAELLQEGWGMAPDTETRTLDNFIVRLRKYFEKDPSNPTHFVTVRGRGYRFQRES